MLTGKYRPGGEVPAGSRATDPQGSRFMHRLLQDDVLELWHAPDNEELEVLAELLGRTIEACRQRFYLLQRETVEEKEARRSRERDLLATRETPRSSQTSCQDGKLSQAAWPEEDRSPWYV